MTLTQASIIVKQGIVISIVTIVLGLAGFIGYQIWHAYYLANLPPVEEKPDTKFGLLPQINFPKTDASSSNFSYTLDTKTGGLPKVGTDPGFEKIVKVYFVTQIFATLLSPDRSNALAEKFGITTPPQILNETKYQFSDQSKNLLVDLDTGNFAFTQTATISGQITLDDDNKLISDFQQTLSTLGILKDDLKNGRNKITLLRIGGAQIPTQLRSEATAAQLSIWPGALDKKDVYTGDFNKALVNATVFGSASNLINYLSLNFTYYPIDAQTFATYPIKTAEVAFDDLKNGKGVVVVVPPKPQVSITSVSLGYYLAEKYSPYLQPIFIFEGPGFVAYVPAVIEQLQAPTK